MNTKVPLTRQLSSSRASIEHPPPLCARSAPPSTAEMPKLHQCQLKNSTLLLHTTGKTKFILSQMIFFFFFFGITTDQDLKIPHGSDTVNGWEKGSSGFLPLLWAGTNNKADKMVNIAKRQLLIMKRQQKFWAASTDWVRRFQTDSNALLAKWKWEQTAKLCLTPFCFYAAF